MKLNKYVLAAMFGLGATGLVQAGTVYMTGSTAARSVVFNALTNAGTVFTAQPAITLYKGGTTGNNAGNGATYMAFSGTLVGGSGTTVIKCDWSGSEAGILDIASNTVITENFIADSLLDGTDHGTNSPATFDTHAVDLAMADNRQSVSRTTKPTLTGTEVGVITFKWVRNPGLWTGTNVTSSMIRQALFGACPLAVFTGNASNTNSFVYVSGRDNLSGTRVNTFGDSGFGILTSPYQIEMNSSGVQQQINGAYEGDFGFSSGGTLAGTMGANTASQTDNNNIPASNIPNTGYSVIAYLGVGDAATAIGNGAVELTYNGVAFSPANVEEGTYTFWGNEYVYRSLNAGTEAQSVYTKLSNGTTGISAFADGTKVIKLSAMHSTRSSPAGDVSHN